MHRLEFVLDGPTDEDLIESFPVFLVSDQLASALSDEELAGFYLDEADVRPSREYLAVHGTVPHKRYRWLRMKSSTAADCWLDDRRRLCVSDRMFSVISRHRIAGCDVTPTT